MTLIRCAGIGGNLLVAATATAVLLAAGCAPGPGANQERYLRAYQPLDAAVSVRVDSLGAVQPVVEVSVPYHSLVFQQTEAGFRAGILAQVVAQRQGDQVGGGVAEAWVTVDDAGATHSDRELECTVPLLVRGREAVKLELTVTAQGTSRIWNRQLRFDPRGSSDIPLYFAAIDWNLESTAGQVLDLGIDRDSLTVDLAIGRHSDGVPWPQGAVWVEARLAAADQDEPLVRRDTLTTSEAGDDGWQFRIERSARAVPFGRVSLSLALVADLAEGRAVQNSGASRTFLNLQVPWWDDRQWRHHVGWLEGLVGDAERERLRETPEADRLAAWQAVWATAGGADGLAGRELARAHLRRIVTADERFGRFGRGALTDRGRVFIQHGEPDRIERRSGAAGSEGRWELWYFGSLRKRFAFFDVHGLGDFHLSEVEDY